MVGGRGATELGEGVVAHLDIGVAPGFLLQTFFCQVVTMDFLRDFVTLLQNEYPALPKAVLVKQYILYRKPTFYKGKKSFFNEIEWQISTEFCEGSDIEIHSRRLYKSKTHDSGPYVL